MKEEDITYQIRGAIYETYKALGPGLLENVYEEALCYFLNKRGLKIERQKELPIIIDNHELESNMRLDLLVEDIVIVELKAVHEMKDLFHQQLLTYLRLSHLHTGILVNFNTTDITKSIWNKVNGYL